jgi:hypothetical protein
MSNGTASETTVVDLVIDTMKEVAIQLSKLPKVTLCMYCLKSFKTDSGYTCHNGCGLHWCEPCCTESRYADHELCETR